MILGQLRKQLSMEKLLLAPRWLSSSLMDICGLLGWWDSLPSTYASGNASAMHGDGDEAAQRCFGGLTQGPSPYSFTEPGREEPRAMLQLLSRSTSLFGNPT